MQYIAKNPTLHVTRRKEIFQRREAEKILTESECKGTKVFSDRNTLHEDTEESRTRIKLLLRK